MSPWTLNALASFPPFVSTNGLATLQAGGRLRASHVQARLDLVHSMLTRPGAH